VDVIVVFPSEPLGIQERVHQVPEQEQREQKSDRIFQTHTFSSHSLDGPHIEPRDQEEQHRDGNEDEIFHANTPSLKGAQP
jgi:hypothetical protein